MKALAKRLVVGTRWEAPVKRVHHALTRSKGSLYDSQTIAIMQRVLRPDSTGIDVGSFDGGFLRHLIRLAPLGHHFAFEPLPDRAKRLERLFPTARVCPFALGESPREVGFHHVLRHPALSGLRRRIDLAAQESSKELRVQMETLDRIVPSDQPVDFVKVDVEGGELGVFRGGIQTLRRTLPVVVFECGLGGADSYGARPEEIFETMTASIGLKISLLDGWLRGNRPLSAGEFAGQFTRSLNYYFVAHRLTRSPKSTDR